MYTLKAEPEDYHTIGSCRLGVFESIAEYNSSLSGSGLINCFPDLVLGDCGATSAQPCVRFSNLRYTNHKPNRVLSFIPL